ncbi:hypothetical protein [Paenibacillus sp. J2TS4]|uniref:hypothetical protein n=1 Tax=Paenibacillus sp. J2TS4 TaxID=2807194 RepID=UPI001B283EA2|nr:hypothetical protein [Paenibacillus sp. J2TS4]GIP34247.1 hypothetical protein J2TS4_34570 [Paenibacillus sp. J2TS4]
MKKVQSISFQIDVTALQKNRLLTLYKRLQKNRTLARFCRDAFIEKAGRYLNGLDPSYAQLNKCIKAKGIEYILEAIQEKDAGVSSTGVPNTGESNTDVSSTGESNTGVPNTDVSSTGESNTDVSSTGESNTDVSSTDVSSTGESSIDESVIQKVAEEIKLAIINELQKESSPSYRPINSTRAQNPANIKLHAASSNKTITTAEGNKNVFQDKPDIEKLKALLS